MRIVYRAFVNELYKLAKQKKTYLALVCINGLSFMVLAFAIFARGYALFRGLDLNLSRYLSLGPFWLREVLALQQVFMTFLGGFFMTVIWGGLVSREFSSQTIRLSLMAPVSRLQIFTAKFLASLCFMAVVFLASLGSLFLALLLIGGSGQSVTVAIDTFRAAVSVSEFKLFGMVNLFFMAFACLVSALSRSTEGCIGLSAFLWTMFTFVDAFIGVLKETGDIGPGLYSWLQGNFTNVVHQTLYKYLSARMILSDLKNFGLEIRFLAGYIFVFTLISAVLFCRREVQ